MWATDGEIGQITDVYFDDDSWSVLYFVVEAGDWLAGRTLLISPQALAKTHVDAAGVQVDLTRDKIKSSPEFDPRKPISRQYEMDLYSHFHWSEYWSSGNWPGGMGTVGMITTPSLPFEEAIHEYVAHEQPSDYPIQRLQDAVGKSVKATDGEAGRLTDLIVEDRHWTILLLVVDGDNGLPKRKFALPPWMIENAGRAQSDITVKADIRQIEQSPEYDDALSDSDAYKVRLDDYYRQSGSTHEEI